MLGRPVRESVARREIMDRRRTLSTAGLSLSISHLAQCSIIPGDRLEQNDLEPHAIDGSIHRGFGGFHLATDINSSQVEEASSLVNKQDDYLAGAWMLIGIQGHPNQVAIVPPYHYNWLCLWPAVAGKAEACTRDPFEQISCAARIGVPGDLFHGCSP